MLTFPFCRVVLSFLKFCFCFLTWSILGGNLRISLASPKIIIVFIMLCLQYISAVRRVVTCHDFPLLFLPPILEITFLCFIISRFEKFFKLLVYSSFPIILFFYSYFSWSYVFLSWMHITEGQFNKNVNSVLINRWSNKY